jgi:hypothetical protein
MMGYLPTVVRESYDLVMIIMFLQFSLYVIAFATKIFIESCEDNYEAKQILNSDLTYDIINKDLEFFKFIEFYNCKVEDADTEHAKDEDITKDDDNTEIQQDISFYDTFKNIVDSILDIITGYDNYNDVEQIEELNKDNEHDYEFVDEIPNISASKLSNYINIIRKYPNITFINNNNKSGISDFIDCFITCKYAVSINSLNKNILNNEKNKVHFNSFIIKLEKLLNDFNNNYDKIVESQHLNMLFPFYIINVKEMTEKSYFNSLASNYFKNSIIKFFSHEKITDTMRNEIIDFYLEHFTNPNKLTNYDDIICSQKIVL